MFQSVHVDPWSVCSAVTCHIVEVKAFVSISARFPVRREIMMVGEILVVDLSCIVMCRWRWSLSWAAGSLRAGAFAPALRAG